MSLSVSAVEETGTASGTTHVFNFPAVVNPNDGLVFVVSFKRAGSGTGGLPIIHLTGDIFTYGDVWNGGLGGAGPTYTATTWTQINIVTGKTLNGAEAGGTLTIYTDQVCVGAGVIMTLAGLDADYTGVQFNPYHQFGIGFLANDPGRTTWFMSEEFDSLSVIMLARDDKNPGAPHAGGTAPTGYTLSADIASSAEQSSQGYAHMLVATKQLGVVSTEDADTFTGIWTGGSPIAQPFLFRSRAGFVDTGNQEGGDYGFDEWWDVLDGTLADTDVGMSISDALPNLSDVDDTVSTAPTTQDILVWSGTEWVRDSVVDGGAP